MNMPEQPRSIWQRYGRAVGPVLALGLMALSATILHRVTREITVADISTAIRAVPHGHIALSMIVALAAMATMGLYDVLSARLAGIRQISAWFAGLAGFCGYAMSNTLGFHIILGGSVRYRIYSAAGLGGRQIAQILALSLGTIWLAVGTIVALVLMTDPMAMPVFGMTQPGMIRAVGVLLAIALVGLIVWLWPGRTVLKLFGWQFPMPNGRGALLQMALGLSDFALAAAALYVLIPLDLRPEFTAFLLIFTTSLIAGSLSHAPGGLGVLEAGILLGLGAVNRPDAVAALVVFRLTYFLVPFVLALVALAIIESRHGVRSWGWLVRPALVALGIGAVIVGLYLFARWM